MSNGFFDPSLAVTSKSRNLPHWNQSDVLYFVTFHLADSIPKEKIAEINQNRIEWKLTHKEPYTANEIKEYNRLFSERIDELLNAGFGSCCLSNPELAKIVGECLKFYNLKRYLLDEWVVMPNHVHVLVKPTNKYDLSKIMHTWKSFTSKEINKKLGKEGQVWTHESFDHIIRNEKSLNRIKEYIKDNPKNAGVKVTQASWL